MQYLLLIYENEKRFSQGYDPAEMGEYQAFGKEFSKNIKGSNALQPTGTAKTVRVRNGKPANTDGPFAETKELIAGFWIWQCQSLQEAIEWAKRCPDAHNEGGYLEIRQIFEADDLGENFTPELRAQEERLMAQIEKDKGR